MGDRLAAVKSGCGPLGCRQQVNMARTWAHAQQLEEPCSGGTAKHTTITGKVTGTVPVVHAARA